MIIFLKLGGSLITDKDRPRTALPEVIHRLGEEIHAAREAMPELALVLGHGSGSFGHIPAAAFHTRDGVHSSDEWSGFLEVWRQARDLNQIMIEELTKAGLPVIAFPPSAFIHSDHGIATDADTALISAAMAARLIPMVAGDVVFDVSLGGTILSTEEVFLALSHRIRPDRVLICGSEEGVWQDFPANQHLVQILTPAEFDPLRQHLLGSLSTDVTGGMLAKVDTMIKLIRISPDTRATIFSGSKPGILMNALKGSEPGTTITSHSGETK